MAICKTIQKRYHPTISETFHLRDKTWYWVGYYQNRHGTPKDRIFYSKVPVIPYDVKERDFNNILITLHGSGAI